MFCGWCRMCASGLGLQKLVDLTDCTDLAQFLIFDVDLEHFLNGEYDFQQCQRVETKIFDETGTVVGRSKFDRRSGGLITFQNPIHDDRYCL